MQIGFIHSDNEEFRKVSQLWKTLTEKGAIDELGIGRIRDYFSDQLFPGTSTLWRHTKYFALMPQIYLEATNYSYNSRREVREHLISLERKMTANLLEGTPEDRRNGITGSDSIKNNSKFVKYDPSYIYFAGMRKYGILLADDLEGMILSLSKKKKNRTDKYIRQSEEEMSDSTDYENFHQFCSCPTGKVDDFAKQCSLILTKDEAEYVRNHILGCPDCKGTLLHHLLTTLPDMTDSIHDYDINTIPESLRNIFICARHFSNFIYGPHLFYNWVLSKHTHQEMYDNFCDWRKEWIITGMNIEKILESSVSISDYSAIDFCADFERHLDDESYLEELIIRREKRVKKSRSKIGKTEYNPKAPIHNYKLSFRWETVKMVVDEIKEGLNNG